MCIYIYIYICIYTHLLSWMRSITKQPRSTRDATGETGSPTQRIRGTEIHDNISKHTINKHNSYSNSHSNNNSSSNNNANNNTNNNNNNNNESLVSLTCATPDEGELF